VQKSDGTCEEIEIYNDDYEQFGVQFENQLIDKPMLCRNKCIFCFMDQLPPKVRETLVFKDDDFRLSFMTGNYVTFTNSGYKDLDRIIKYHLSPINVSVHATDPEVRKMMLNNKNAGMILNYIKYLTDNGIQVNAQIVLCPGINDGKILDKTIQELSVFYPVLL
jgi:putative radical SAM enzyme (TIGR03279 family)